MPPRRIYLDMCAWKRPHDRLTGERVRLEALAVAALLDAASAGKIDIVSSTVLVAENERNPDPVRRGEVRELLRAIPDPVLLTEPVVARARALEPLGLRPLDALHVASAEAAGCSHLVTSDDRMAARLGRNSAALHVRVVDPIRMIEMLEGEDA